MGAGGANVAAAKAAIAAYSDHPSAFPVTAPLGKRLKPGMKIDYLEPDTQTAAQAAKPLEAAAKALGATLQPVNAGTTATSAQTAAATVLAQKPAAVILGGIQLSYFGNSLKKLSAAGIKVISDAIAQNTKPFGITFNYDGAADFRLVGKLMADWVIVRRGAAAKVVFYSVPALDFSSAMQQGFERELNKNCSGCSVRVVPINIATLGTTAAQTVVSDLQANAGTNTAVFGVDEIAAGLPAAESAAGLSHITTIGYAPNPEELGYIKAGQMTAGLGLDLSVFNWTMFDIIARLTLHEKLTPAEAAGSYPMEFLTQKNVTASDVTNGWAGYPNYVKRFTKLWHPSK